MANYGIRHIDLGACVDRNEWKANDTHAIDYILIPDGAGHYLQVPKLTTVQRDGLTPVNGMIVYNTTTGRFESYSGAWGALGVTDHGALDGLADDDHTQYVLRNILTAQGDIFLRGATAIERLGIGTKRFSPRVNEAGNALEYVKGYEFGQKIRPWQWEMAFFDLTTAVTGSGVIYAQNYGSFWIRTGATAGSTARGRGYNFGWIQWATLDFEWYISCWTRESTTNGLTWIKIDADTAANPAARAVGWRIDNQALKGIVHNGTSLDVVDLSVTWADHEYKELYLKFVHGDKVYWYVDGVEKGNSANIPTETEENNAYVMFAVTNGIDDAWQSFQVGRHGWIAEALI